MCASLTVHSKMADWLKRNAIGSFACDCFLPRRDSMCWEYMHNVSSTRVAEFDFPTENLDSDPCLTSAYSLWFSFKRFLYHVHWVLNVIYRCKFCKNGVFNTFFPLSRTFYFKTRPIKSSLKKRRKCIWCALSAALSQKRVRWPPFFISWF